MTSKRKVEIYSAGCPLCEETIALVRKISCKSCDITIVDMNDKDALIQAQKLGINRVPAVVVDGKLADCCSVGAPNEADLRAAGIGKPI